MKFTNQKEKIAALEALLFIHGEPMTPAKIEKVLGIGKEEIPELVNVLGKIYREADRGLALLREGDDVQLVTKPVFGPFIGEFLKEEMKEELTPAALETLSLVAYLGPISRARIEYIRGVNSSFTLRNLRIRGLVDRVPIREASQVGGKAGRDLSSTASYLYAPSTEFMRHLGILRKEDLPDYEKFNEILTFEEPEGVLKKGEAV